MRVNGSLWPPCIPDTKTLNIPDSRGRSPPSVGCLPTVCYGLNVKCPLEAVTTKTGLEREFILEPFWMNMAPGIHLDAGYPRFHVLMSQPFCEVFNSLTEESHTSRPV